MEHVYSKLGLGTVDKMLVEPKFMSGTEKSDDKKLGLKKGGHACEKKMAMGGVGKERLGQD